MTLLFDAKDLAGAQRLNCLLNLLPRFRVSRRFNALAAHALLLSGQALSASAAHRMGVRVEERVVSVDGLSVRVRILTPPGQPKAVYLDMHGGAWIVGNARFDDVINARIATECAVAVVSVDFRLALDDRLDRCIRDCSVAAGWLARNGLAEFGCDRIIVGGESSGAHLAGCTLLRLRDRWGARNQLAGAILFYGGFDMSGRNFQEAPRDALLVDGASTYENVLRLTKGMTDEERRHPDISPLYADLGGLPPALFLVGSLDPIAGDTREMCGRWQAANGNAELVEAPEAPHGFNHLPTRMARKTNAYVRTWIRGRV